MKSREICECYAVRAEPLENACSTNYSTIFLVLLFLLYLLYRKFPSELSCDLMIRQLKHLENMP